MIIIVAFIIFIIIIIAKATQNLTSFLSPAHKYYITYPISTNNYHWQHNHEKKHF